MRMRVRVMVKSGGDGRCERKSDGGTSGDSMLTVVGVVMRVTHIRLYSILPECI